MKESVWVVVQGLVKKRAKPAGKTVLRFVSVTGFALYLVWNAYFIAAHRIPPSIWLAFTGLPCPTTGGVRALTAAWHGHWRDSLSLNPFMIPFVLLTAGSCLCIFWSKRRLGRPVLPRPLATGWWVCLGLAWIFQSSHAFLNRWLQ